MSFEPHLSLNRRRDSKHFDDRDGMDGAALLEQLDKIAPIRAFDAFPKVQPTYQQRSSRGGVLTAVIAVVIFLLVLNDLGEYMYGDPTFSFAVDHALDGKNSNLQLNVDLTVAMPCHYLTIDLRDVLGDRLHLSDDFTKHGTVFAPEANPRLVSAAPPAPTVPSASKIVHDARRGLPASKTRRSLSKGLSNFFRRQAAKAPKKHLDFLKTDNMLPAEGPDAGPACRIFGSVEVKKATANLHVTTLGHGYMSFEHTQHELMNLSHIVHEFSFGPYFPAIAQPLDMSYKIASGPFSIYQYFLSVVPTTYIDAGGRKVKTSQYAVTDYERVVEHGKGIPGIFFKFDVDALNMTVEERTTSLFHFLIRLVGVVGGVWTTAAFALRIFARAEREVKTKVLGKKADEDDDGFGGPTLLPRSTPGAGTPGRSPGLSSGGGSDYMRPHTGPRRGSSWLNGQGGNGSMLVQ